MKKLSTVRFPKSFEHSKQITAGIFCFFALLLFAQNVVSQNDDVIESATTQNADTTISIKIVSAEKINITGRFKNPASAIRKWTFPNEYADAVDFAKRVENFQLFDAFSKKLDVKRTAIGEFQSTEVPVLWSYDVDLKPSVVITDSAHVSWLTENHGVLMLGDLLPLEMRKNTKFVVEFLLPPDFQVGHDKPFINIGYGGSQIGVGAKSINFPNKYFINSRIEDDVFFVGRDGRKIYLESFEKKPIYNFSLSISGRWQFSDDEAAEMIVSIVQEYVEIFGNQPPNLIPQVILTPFPQKGIAPDRWRAETRGGTVTIISGVIPQKNVALQRLHEQLRHEMFHIWLPNAVNLSGDYAWFYEGFTIYQALKTGVWLNQIRFEDYLNTLSRAYDIAQNDANGRNVSLIELSRKRWAGANNYIYAKGLLVAFLCDVAMLRESKGKRNLKDVFRVVYQKHRAPAQIQDGNSAIIGILKSYSELNPIVQSYIEGKSGIDWRESLEAAGIESESVTATQLKVKTNLSGRQKDLLDDLGYNQWRKLLQKKK